MDTIQLLKAYLGNHLLPDEIKDFEELLESTSPKLKAEISAFFNQPKNKNLHSQFQSRLKEKELFRSKLVELLNSKTIKNQDGYLINDEIILDYHAGYLVKKDQEIINQILKKHPNLVGYFDEKKQLLFAIKSLKEENTKPSDAELMIQKMSDKFRKEGIPEPPSTKSTAPTKTLSRKWMIAAFIGLLLLAGDYFLTKQSTTNYAHIYATYHNSPDKIGLSLLDSIGKTGFANSENPQKDLKEPLLFYKDGEYDKAIPLLEKYLIEHSEDDTAKFILALNFQAIGNHKRAINIYENLIGINKGIKGQLLKTGDSENEADITEILRQQLNANPTKHELTDEALYQLAISYLTTTETAPTSKNIFEFLSKIPNAFFREKSALILKEFNN